MNCLRSLDIPRFELILIKVTTNCLAKKRLTCVFLLVVFVVEFSFFDVSFVQFYEVIQRSNCIN